MRSRHLCFLGLVLAALLPGFGLGESKAQAFRTWVSGVGDDANPCSRTAPCRTFAGAISKTAAGGVIDALDPGGFGALTITKSITVNGSGFPGGILASGTHGVVINAAGIDVVLRGLTIDGAGSGLDGVRILNAGNVFIESVQIEGFTGDAIAAIPSAAVASDLTVSVRNVSVHDVAGAAVAATHGASGQQVRVAVSDLRASKLARGVALGARSRAQVERAVIHGGTDAAVVADGSADVAEALVLDSQLLNGGAGVRAIGAQARVALSGSTVSGNASGVAFSGGGRVASFGDNRILDNLDNGQPSEELGKQ